MQSRQERGQNVRVPCRDLSPLPDAPPLPCVRSGLHHGGPPGARQIRVLHRCLSPLPQRRRRCPVYGPGCIMQGCQERGHGVRVLRRDLPPLPQRRRRFLAYGPGCIMQGCQERGHGVRVLRRDLSPLCLASALLPRVPSRLHRAEPPGAQGGHQSAAPLPLPTTTASVSLPRVPPRLHRAEPPGAQGGHQGAAPRPLPTASVSVSLPRVPPRLHRAEPPGAQGGIRVPRRDLSPLPQYQFH